MKYTGKSDGRAFSVELVTDTVEARLRLPENGLEWQELGAPTATGKAPGVPLKPDCELTHFDIDSER